ncbi:TetR/AcrR family transcriptional regulator [Hoeflea prorocentri]|uniref:TetR/AcrR family transcriptional regulator n=1 Tax=Hoeflea prorocentri TaxID=1922333 RepID=A0A9X3UH58_9HYPH|nr:TetR/AcrR family transcriptional regulator [Hoeflea prorocentri]MCY6380753.1 TetR/AcrR family transcriptional regulator [Hoeflea prorocentri]MDA5398553.1 TetR/AcrR family transcriptional regulator [Hoeflea prorocentri]
MIADVVENGLDKAPVSRIAKRAGVSAGTIYVYYPNKDEMLQSIYLEIKSLLHDAMMTASGPGADSAKRIRSMWFAMFGFMLENPDMFAFHEIVAAEKLLGPDQLEEVAGMAGDIHGVLGDAINDRTLKDMPMDCVISLLFGPAVNLARRMLSGGSHDLQKADLVFRSIWTGIAR